MTDGITLDKVNVEIESNSSKAASSIDKLTESIKKLQSATTGGIGELSKLNTTIKGIVDNINNNFNNVGNVNTENIKRNISNTINKIDKSFTGISSKALKNKFNIKPEFDFDSIKEDTSILSEYGEKTKIISKNGEVVSVTLKKVENGIQTVTNVSKKGIVQTEKYTNEQSKLYKVLSAFGKIGFLGIAKKVFTGIGKYTDMSSQYISNMNYFNTTMGTMKDTATDFVNTMERDFHLDPSNVMNYMASFNSLIKGFGIADEQAYKMSKNLTQLSYDLAAFKGLSIEDAMQKIKSGISGELEPMRAIGVALDQATLQETAYELGIKKRVSTMTRAQKTELLYYQMMQSTSQAQNYFANTLAKTSSQLDGSTKLILNPASALSILKQQFSQLGRAIGNIFIPILTKMIPYIMAATQVLMDLANAIAAAFGFKLSDYDFSSTAGGISSGIDGIGESADKTAKKVKGMLAPFDELNTIDFGNNNGGNGSVGGGGSLGLPEQNYEWFKNEALTEKVQEIKEKFEALLPIVEAIGAAFLTWKIASGVSGFINTLLGGGLEGQSKGLKISLGITLVVAGLVLIINGVKKIMNGEITPQSIAETALGIGLAAGGVMVALSALNIQLPLAASLAGLSGIAATLATFGGIAAIITGLIASVASFIEMLQNGFSWFQEFIMVLGTAAVAVGAIILGVSAPVALIAAAIAAVVATLTTLTVGFFKEKAAIKDATKAQQEYTEAKEKTKEAEETYMDATDRAKETLKELKDIQKETGINGEELYQKVQDGAIVYDEMTEKQKKVYRAYLDNKKAQEKSKKATEEYNKAKKDEVNASLENQLALGKESGSYDTFKQSVVDAFNKGQISADEARDLIERSLSTMSDASQKTFVEDLPGDIKEGLDPEKYETGAKKFGDWWSTKFDEFGKTVSDWWTNSVSPWFTKEKWQEIGNNAIKGIKEIYNDWKQRFQPIKDWWTNSVSPWFTKEKWQEIGNNAIKGIKEIYNDWKQRFQPIKDWWTNSVSPWFTKEKWQQIGKDAVKGIKETLKLDGIKLKMPHIKWSADGYQTSGWVSKALEALNLPTKLPKLSVSWYAEGGFPSVGDLFIANENGPEWISTMGGKSAVANQDQMTTGIRQAAYEGVSQALRENPQSHKTEVNIGNRRVYEGYGSYQTRQANKYGVSTVTV